MPFFARVTDGSCVPMAEINRSPLAKEPVSAFPSVTTSSSSSMAVLLRSTRSLASHRVHDHIAAFRCVCSPAWRTSVKFLILVVDDEPDVELLFRQQFRRDLRDGRFTMEFAQSAQGALQRITECEEDTSLILSCPKSTSPG